MLQILVLQNVVNLLVVPEPIPDRAIKFIAVNEVAEEIESLLAKQKQSAG